MKNFFTFILLIMVGVMTLPWLVLVMLGLLYRVSTLVQGDG